MKIYYRISDNGYAKPKLPGATKEFCLDNFLAAFPADLITVICDRCNPATIEMVQLRKLQTIQTDLGNAGSFRYALGLACDQEDRAYFVEDDYLHLPDAAVSLEEGFQFGDYVTIYDHPDKYTSQYSFGEKSKVMRGRTKHWRFTQSTCMTFAATAKVLRHDREVWERFTQGDHPHDHHAFMEVTYLKLNPVALCIPGAAIHTDMTAPGCIEFMEPWAIKMLSGIR